MDDLISRKALLEQIEQQRRTSKTGFPIYPIFRDIAEIERG